MECNKKEGKIKQLQLTEREKIIVEFIGRGYTQPQIAKKLCITGGTLKIHLQHIMKKTCTRNQTEVALFALRTNLVSMDEINFGRDDYYPDFCNLNTWRRWIDASVKVLAQEMVNDKNVFDNRT